MKRNKQCCLYCKNCFSEESPTEKWEYILHCKAENDRVVEWEDCCEKYAYDWIFDLKGDCAFEWNEFMAVQARGPKWSD